MQYKLYLYDVFVYNLMHVKHVEKFGWTGERELVRIYLWFTLKLLRFFFSKIYARKPFERKKLTHSKNKGSLTYLKKINKNRCSLGLYNNIFIKKSDTFCSNFRLRDPCWVTTNYIWSYYIKLIRFFEIIRRQILTEL